ncbi:hypothetical protein [Chryseobacterium foetidum]|uniref:hypothetical protein n=1 Tax=Chryseobacterium foetidum TaxID=2951057 RepID=UPI0021C8F65C|nr:hypothetical protein [Chryseobacterium foetidum]
MIMHNGGIAIDLLDVKAIHMEFLKQGGNLIFELNNIFLPIYNEETHETELKSFANDPVKYYIQTSDSLRAYFEEWVQMWQDSKD